MSCFYQLFLYNSHLQTNICEWMHKNTREPFTTIPTGKSSKHGTVCTVTGTNFIQFHQLFDSFQLPFHLLMPAVGCCFQHQLQQTNEHTLDVPQSSEGQTQTLIASDFTLKTTEKVMLKHSDWWVPYDNGHILGNVTPFQHGNCFIWVTMVLEVRLQLTSQHDSAMPAETQLELEKGVAQTNPNRLWLWLSQMVNRLYEISYI